MVKRTMFNKSFIMPLVLLLAIWIGFFLQTIGVVTGCEGAIIPLTLEGLKGIFFSPLLHGSLDHIVANSIPLAILAYLLYQFYPKVADFVILYGWLFSGLAVWLFPQIDYYNEQFYTSCIIGISGVVYVIAFFLFASGVIRWNLKLLTISLFVAFYFGGMIWGIFPEELFFSGSGPSRISWQSHLFGAIIGIIMAFIYRKKGERKKKYIWEYPNYYNEKDDFLWQKYISENPQEPQELPYYTKKKDIWDYLDKLRKRDQH